MLVHAVNSTAIQWLENSAMESENIVESAVPELMEVAEVKEDDNKTDENNQREDFTSEIFKIEVTNLGKFGHGVSFDCETIRETGYR